MASSSDSQRLGLHPHEVFQDPPESLGVGLVTCVSHIYFQSTNSTVTPCSWNNSAMRRSLAISSSQPRASFAVTKLITAFESPKPFGVKHQSGHLFPWRPTTENGEHLSKICAGSNPHAKAKNPKQHSLPSLCRSSLESSCPIPLYHLLRWICVVVSYRDRPSRVRAAAGAEAPLSSPPWPESRKASTC